MAAYDQGAHDRAKRLAWWHQARFGMFVHWGLYAQLGRHEWAMNRERIPLTEYETLARSFKPKPRAARAWARLAKAAGMKYMVMTTKHHEGFCNWDSAQTDYNAVKTGPGRDLVREYVDACREFGLRIGFYYSLMDWHHPDGARCAVDEPARRRFLDFTQGCVRELLTNYGKIDILWYDVSWPLSRPELWESARMNAMARRLQPHIIINNRSQLDEDFGTPEEHIKAEGPGRAWEACMTFNGSWGWQPAPPEDWHSVRSVLNMLRTCAAGGGNLLLNIGPKPDGSVPAEAVDRLTAVGRWLAKYGAAAYGAADRVEGMEWMPTGAWTRKGRMFYYWCSRWPGEELAIGGLTAKLVSARLFPRGELLPFSQTDNRLVIGGLPKACPDSVAGIGIVELKFKDVPRQILGAGCVVVAPPGVVTGKWHSPFLSQWQVSRLVPRRGTVATAPVVKRTATLDWQPLAATNPDGFVNVHDRYGDGDGLVYLATRVKTATAGAWDLLIGHDGGVRAFVNGRAVLCQPRRENPAMPDRSRASVRLRRGVNDILVALDTDHGLGWGIFARFQVSATARRTVGKPRFPTPA